MAIRSIFRSSILPSAFVAIVAASGCVPETGDDDGGAGEAGTGGAMTAGTGGASPMNGGAGPSNGGSAGASAGASGTAGKGGSPGSGGAGTGGSPAGGTPGNGGGGVGGGVAGAGGGVAGDSSGGASMTGGVGGAMAGAAGSTGGTPPTAGAGGSAGGQDPLNGYNPDFKEFVGEDCTVTDPATSTNAALPDLFEKLDGTRMTTKAEWPCRRAELKKIVEKFIHGEKPGRPEMVTGTVTSSSITVNVQHMGKSASFSVSISIPAGAKMPAPIIIGLGGGSLDRAILTAEGVATGNYNNNAISSETSRSGLFSNIYGSTGASAQVGWAWGISRVIDVLVDEAAAGRNNIIDPKAVGVTGCSRLGKGAFTIGAFDERIALGIPQESGTGGVSAFRVVNTAPIGPNNQPAQSLSSAWTEAQGWFGTTFGTYRTQVNSIPGDTHSLVAMYAPRGLLVLDNSRIGELCASCQHAASAAGALVYKALGVEANIEYHGGRPDDPHNHCMFYPEQADGLRNAIRAHLTHTAAPAGTIHPQPDGTADLTRWIDWDAPTLN